MYVEKGTPSFQARRRARRKSFGGNEMLLILVVRTHGICQPAGGLSSTTVLLLTIRSPCGSLRAENQNPNMLASIFLSPNDERRIFFEKETGSDRPYRGWAMFIRGEAYVTICQLSEKEVEDLRDGAQRVLDDLKTACTCEPSA